MRKTRESAVNRTIGGLVKTEPKIRRVLDVYFFFSAADKQLNARLKGLNADLEKAKKDLDKAKDGAKKEQAQKRVDEARKKLDAAVAEQLA